MSQKATSWEEKTEETKKRAWEIQNTHSKLWKDNYGSPKMQGGRESPTVMGKLERWKMNDETKKKEQPMTNI